jgi:hypothetical protein
MYEAFDEFLNVETWESFQEEDQRRFYRALDKVVRNRDFRTSRMVEYIEQKYIQKHGAREDKTHLDDVKDRCREAADTVKSYLEATGR